MKTKLTLFAVAVMAVMVFHFQALTRDSIYIWAHTGDVFAIQTAYDKVPNFWSGAASWFTGSWINTDAGAFRPLPSMMHYWQVAATDAGYDVPVILSTMLMFALMCFLVGLIARRWADDTAGYIAVVLCAAFPRAFEGRGGDMLSWWPLTDNLLTILFSLGCILAFDVWLETGNRRYAVGALALLFLATLSKEWSYIVPVMLLAATTYGVKREDTVRRLWPVALAFLIVAAVVVYRGSILPRSHDANGGMAINNWWLDTGLTKGFWANGLFYVLVLIVDQWRDVLLSTLPALPVLFGVLVAWNRRTESKLLTGALMVMLSLIPIAGFSLTNHRLAYPWAFGVLVTASLLSIAWGQCRTYALSRRISNLSTPPMPQFEAQTELR